MRTFRHLLITFDNQTWKIENPIIQVGLRAEQMMSKSTDGLVLPGAALESVRNYYGKVLSSSKDLKTSACTSSNRPSPSVLSLFKHIPAPVIDKFYGCGTPLPTSINGLTVLDLGCGSGRDCYLASALVGESGSVIGVDMTAEQLSTARAHVDEMTASLGYPKPNMRFVEGYIEFLEDAGVSASSVDLVISNCVINLSPNKEAVLRGCYAALRQGGELFFSDVYADRRLTQAAREDDLMVGECLGGALYVEDFRRIARQVGFADPRELTREEIVVGDPALQLLCGGAKFYSITFRCFKLPQLETLCEDYGQVAIYKGTIVDAPVFYALDDHHVFEKGRPMLVCGNTASMVGESWLSPHFDVIGSRDVHYGLFDCTPAPKGAPAALTCAGGACC